MREGWHRCPPTKETGRLGEATAYLTLLPTFPERSRTRKLLLSAAPPGGCKHCFIFAARTGLCYYTCLLMYQPPPTLPQVLLRFLAIHVLNLKATFSFVSFFFLAKASFRYLQAPGAPRRVRGLRGAQEPSAGRPCHPGSPQGSRSRPYQAPARPHDEPPLAPGPAPQRPPETPRSPGVGGRPPQERRGAAPMGNGHQPPDPTAPGTAHPPAPSPREAVSRDRAHGAPSVRHFRLGRWRRH